MDVPCAVGGAHRSRKLIQIVLLVASTLNSFMLRHFVNIGLLGLQYLGVAAIVNQSLPLEVAAVNLLSLPQTPCVSLRCYLPSSQ